MPYSEMFPDPAERRARILEQVAEHFRMARWAEFAALELLAELRDEPDKVLARQLVEAVRIDSRKAYAMLRA